MSLLYPVTIRKKILFHISRKIGRNPAADLSQNRQAPAQASAYSLPNESVLFLVVSRNGCDAEQECELEESVLISLSRDAISGRSSTNNRLKELQSEIVLHCSSLQNLKLFLLCLLLLMFQGSHNKQSNNVHQKLNCQLIRKNSIIFTNHVEIGILQHNAEPCCNTVVIV